MDEVSSNLNPKLRSLHLRSRLAALFAYPKQLPNRFAVIPGNLQLGRFIIVAALLYDWLMRFLNRDLFYAHNGTLPPHLNAFTVEPWHYSIFYLGSSPFLLTLCFLLGLGAYLGLALSSRTRLYAALSLIFQVSLANRNIYPGFCTDIYSALLLWFILFPTRGSIHPFLVFGYIFQIGLIYSASGVAKITPGSEWLNGTAISYIAQYSNITNQLGSLLGQFPVWLQWLMCYSTLALEVLALPLLLWPVTRNLMVLLLISFHVLTFTTMNLGELPLIMTGALLSISTFPLSRKPNPSPGTPLTASPTENSLLFPSFRAQSAIYATLALFFVTLISADVFNRVFHPFLGKWSIRTKPVNLPLSAQYVCGLLRIRQTWTMYSSPLPKTLVWPMIAVTTKSGREFNLINQRKVSWKKPKNLAYYYDHRLYKYYNALYGFHAAGQTNLVQSAGQFLVKDWNARNPSDPMQHIGIWYAFAPIESPKSVRWVKIY